MSAPGAGPKRGYYLLNTDAGMASGHGRRRSGDLLGHAAVGALLRTTRLITVAQISKAIGPATHNEAEYRALIEGLKLAGDYGVDHLRVYMDSELVVDQVNGVSAVKEARLVELQQAANELRAQFKSIRISWVPRAMNAEADRLASDALGVLVEAPDNPEPGQQKPKPKAKAKSPALKTLPDEERAAYLLEHDTIADRAWTDKPRLTGEKRDDFIRRILLGEGGAGQTVEDSVTDRGAFFAQLEGRVDATYEAEPRLPDRRSEYPWVTGYLGDPFAPVWFVAEAPSLSRIETAARTPQTPEMQWAVSPGDKLFRRMLSKHGFKTGGEFTPGGWRCYITDVIKSSYRVSDWQTESDDARLAVAEAWADALRYELTEGRPKLLVILGDKTRKPLMHLVSRNRIQPLPEYVTIYHYSYIGSRPQGTLGPMHPTRVAAWDAEFAKIARRRDQFA